MDCWRILAHGREDSVSPRSAATESVAIPQNVTREAPLVEANLPIGGAIQEHNDNINLNAPWFTLMRQTLELVDPTIYDNPGLRYDVSDLPYSSYLQELKGALSLVFPIWRT